MKLSQLFSGEVRTDSASSHTNQLTPAQMEQANRQLRSLVPGQTISGEILSRNGGEVQIRISEDIILNARVDRNLNLEVGKNMTFEVKNNGSSLTLSPLFTNVATDITVLKALDMAGLPVNRVSIDMTQQLMAAGMPVNRNNLQQIFREINSFPQGEVSDIVNLHRLQMPVNEANVNQMISYRNLNHQLTQGMDAILDALPEVFDSMMEQGDAAGAVKLYQEVLQLIRDGGMTVSGEGAADGLPGQINGETGTENAPGNFAGDGLRLPSGDVSGIMGTGENVGPEGVQGGVLSPEMLQEIFTGSEEMPMGAEEQSRGQMLPGKGAEGMETAAAEQPVQGGGTGEQVPMQIRTAAAREMLEILDSVKLPSGEASALRSQILQFVRGETDVRTFFGMLSSYAQETGISAGSARLLEKLFSGSKFRQLLSGQLKAGWMLRPEEVASPGRVEEMYRRLDRQLRSLESALESAGQTGGTAYRAVSSMSQNLDFLQQLNQMYTYVQLPLRLQQRDAQGELYVYTNKKKLTSQDGTVSALLHLDMEYLGPLDVYVSMKSSRVTTRFYLRDDEIIGFMEKHLDTLTQRLQKRGYDCSFSMVVRTGVEATKGGLEPVLAQNKGIMLSHYAFDVRT